MSAGDILDQAIRIYRRNFVPLVSIVAVVSIPIAVLQVLAALVSYPLGSSVPNAESFDTGRLLLGQGITFLAGIAAAIAAIFQSGALASFVSERFLERPSSVRHAYGRALSRWLGLLIAVFLIGVVNAVVFGTLFGVFLIPLVSVAALGSGLDSGASAVLGTISLVFCCLLVPAVVAAVFLNTRWAFFIQAIVLENYNSTGGMGRSWKLVKGSFWRVFLFLLVLGIIVYSFSVGPILLVAFGSALLASPILTAVITSIASTLITIVVTPLQFAALTVLYYDLRIRKEGFDLQMQMQQLPEPPMFSPLTPANESANEPSDLPSLYSREYYTQK